MATETNLAGAHSEWVLNNVNKDFVVTAQPSGAWWHSFINGFFVPSTLNVAAKKFTTDRAPSEHDELAFDFATSGSAADYASIVGIVNIGLHAIGANPISNMSGSQPNEVKAAAVWDYCLTELLELRDWSFCKTRVALTQNSTDPLYGYSHAYNLPSDFVRLARKRNPGTVRNQASLSSWQSHIVEASGGFIYADNDPPIYPECPYKIEMLPDGTKVLETDYLATDANPLYINYIKRTTDPTYYSSLFIQALAHRIAAALAVSIKESLKEALRMNAIYMQYLKAADDLNQNSFSVDNETGSNSWEMAGR